MTDHTDLVRRLEKSAEARAPVDMHKEPLFSEAAAAIRALAGEVEQLTEELETAEAVHDGVALERDTLRAEVERLKSQVACLEMNLHHEQDGRGQR